MIVAKLTWDSRWRQTRVLKYQVRVGGFWLNWISRILSKTKQAKDNAQGWGLVEKRAQRNMTKVWSRRQSLLALSHSSAFLGGCFSTEIFSVLDLWQWDGPWIYMSKQNYRHTTLHPCVCTDLFCIYYILFYTCVWCVGKLCICIYIIYYVFYT